jgi:hypothetical protein
VLPFSGTIVFVHIYFIRAARHRRVHFWRTSQMLPFREPISITILSRATANPKLAAATKRSRVELLLAQEVSGDNFLEGPASDLLADFTMAQLPAGTQLGAYVNAGALAKQLRHGFFAHATPAA